MRHGRISPEVDYPSSNERVWTIPVASDNGDLPSYNHFIASQSETSPPNYFDMSIIPEGAVLHYSEIIPYHEASKTIIERKKDYVLSIDPLIDKNPDQLWLYFMTYLNEKPRLFLNILGQHAEYNTSSISYQTVNGHYLNRGGDRTRLFTDFNYSIDLTAYVSEHCWRIAVIPSKMVDDQSVNINFRDALEQYTRSGKSFKEIRCQKQLIGWNFEELRFKIKDLILSNGYSGVVCVNFSVDNQQIIARTSSKLNRFSQSIWSRLLCFLSCLWLVFAPIYFYLRATGSMSHQIAADYQMLSSSEMFLRMNAQCIVKAALTRSKKRLLARVT